MVAHKLNILSHSLQAHTSCTLFVSPFPCEVVYHTEHVSNRPCDEGVYTPPGGERLVDHVVDLCPCKSVLDAGEESTCPVGGNHDDCLDQIRLAH